MELNEYIVLLKQIDAPMQHVFYWFKQEVKMLLQKTHTAGLDPYQTPWVARKKLYPHPIMDKSSDMLRGYKVTIAGSRFTISNSVPYAKYHQEGTDHSRYLPVRNVIPTEAQGIPVQWVVVLQDYFLMKMQEYLK